MKNNSLLCRAYYPFGGSSFERSIFAFFSYLCKLKIKVKVVLISLFITLLCVTSILINLPAITNGVINSNEYKRYFIDKHHSFKLKYSDHNKVKSVVAKYSDSVNKLQKDFPSINFNNIKSAKEASQLFYGKNSFMSLATIMEGYRGDLHKDPAVGLNIGYGYNITKRLNGTDGLVRSDLLSIGLNNSMIDEIILIAQLPQASIQEAIFEFNEINNVKEIINQKQALALLYRLQAEYKLSSSKVFPKFAVYGKNQQEVLTYATYKAGEGSMLKYKKFHNNLNRIYSKKSAPNNKDLILASNELKFYYKKDGNKKVLDKRANLISKVFVSQQALID